MSKTDEAPEYPAASQLQTDEKPPKNRPSKTVVTSLVIIGVLVLAIVVKRMFLWGCFLLAALLLTPNHGLIVQQSTVGAYAKTIPEPSGFKHSLYRPNCDINIDCEDTSWETWQDTTFSRPLTTDASAVCADIVQWATKVHATGMSTQKMSALNPEKYQPVRNATHLSDACMRWIHVAAQASPGMMSNTGIVNLTKRVMVNHRPMIVTGSLTGGACTDGSCTKFGVVWNTNVAAG